MILFTSTKNNTKNYNSEFRKIVISEMSDPQDYG